MPQLFAKVEIYNRGAAFTRSRSQRCLLTINRKRGTNDVVNIVLLKVQSKQQVEYKIDSNIEQIFTKFVKDGKATIRLHEPCHDLIIQGNPMQLKNFLHMLKLALAKKLDKAPSLSNIQILKTCPLPNVNVDIKKISEYPTFEGFPRITEKLRLHGLNKKTFDRQILKLHCLKTLVLSKNLLTSLPKDLGVCLPFLEYFDLSENQLGKSSQCSWAWLDSHNIRRNLCYLDISSNFLTVLPNQIGNVKALKNLKVSHNMLTCLPQSIGTLKLRCLDVSRNSLSYLPGSFRHLRLSYLDISSNSFFLSAHQYFIYEVNKLKAPTLVECSARCFLKGNSRQWYDWSLIPRTLIAYLDEAKYCYVCGSACFDYGIKKHMYFTLSDISSEIKRTGGEESIGTLKLRYLDVSRNSLSYLPGSSRKNELEEISKIVVDV